MEMQNLLEAVNLWFLVEKEVKLPTVLEDLAKYNKIAVNSKRVLLDSVKDHLIPHIGGKSIAKEMYDALGTLY
jgi:hypothetical protein